MVLLNVAILIADKSSQYKLLGSETIHHSEASIFSLPRSAASPFCMSTIYLLRKRVRELKKYHRAQNMIALGCIIPSLSSLVSAVPPPPDDDATSCNKQQCGLYEL